ncbi:MAG TPA: DUF4158 domain-containing protein, partial [Acidimicrobiales bacterium]|nr:DUF4158 domain-containing protein [Acidimicrobiales bacterium]
DTVGPLRRRSNPEQLVRFFTLSPADLRRADRARSRSNRLGYVVQLATVRFLGAFLADPAETPEVVVSHLAAQVDADPASWAD